MRKGKTVNFGNVVKSFLLGIGIGVIINVASALQPGGGASDVGTWSLTIAAGGLIGLVIGLVTEWLTALLPIRMARTRTYFVINGVIALIVTTAVLLLARAALGGGFAAADWWQTLGAILLIVTIANILDYAVYARTNARLRARQADLLRLVSDDSTSAVEGRAAGRLEQ